MKTAIVTDSTVFLKDEYLDRDNLFVIPVPIIIDDQMFMEGVDIKADTFYEQLNNAKEFPKTSQPSVGEVIELYEDIASKGYDSIISIHLSSGISGFVRTLQGLSEELASIDVYAFDSLLTTGPMGKLVEVALDLSQEACQPEKIVDELTQLRNHLEGFIVVDDLNHLVRGGRLRNGAAIIGTLLKIKPILKFEEGNIVLSEKVRSQKKALSRLEDIVLNEISLTPDQSTFYVIHCNNLEVAERVQNELLTIDSTLDVTICEFGPVIGAHLGEKAVAIGVAPKSIEALS